MSSFRIKLVCLFASLCVFPVAASDFGLDIHNKSAFADSTTTTWSFNQSNKASLWFSSPISSSLHLYCSALYEFSGLFSTDAPVMTPYRFDVGRVALAGNYPALFGESTRFDFMAGRVPLQDFSGKIMNGLNDGFKAEFGKENSLITLSAGYLGFLYKKDALVLIDSDDVMAYIRDSVSGKDYFAPSRTFFGLSYNISELLQSYDFGMEAWGQLDLGTGSVKTNTFYLEPSLSGRIARLFRWSAWGVYELGSDGEWFSAFAAGGRIRMTVPELLFLRVTASALLAGGEFANSVKSFTPIRQSTIASVYSSVFTDSIMPRVEIGFTPIAPLTINALGSVFIRNGSVTPSGFSSDSDSMFIGTEVSGNALYKMASDLNFTIDGGIFLPNTDNAYPVGTHPQWNVSLSAALSI